MKQITQTPGGRRYAGNDFLAMQDLTLKLTEGFYSQFGNFILYGCERTGNNIAEGIVMLDGKACIFAGSQGAGTPFYVKKVVINENVPYLVGEGLGYQTYAAQPCAAGEQGAFRLDNAKRFKQFMAPDNVLTDKSEPWIGFDSQYSSNFRAKFNEIGDIVLIGEFSIPAGFISGNPIAVDNGFFINRIVRISIVLPSGYYLIEKDDDNRFYLFGNNFSQNTYFYINEIISKEW
jgi:hypothetical protein